MKETKKRSFAKAVMFTLLTAVMAVSLSVFAFAGADEGAFSPEKEIHSFFGASAYENTHVNTGNKAYDIIEVAKTQIGYAEKGNNLTKYGEYFGSNGTSWCAMFVVWCARQAGITPDEIQFTTWATADDLGIEYRGRNAARTREIDYIPLPGDVIIYDWGPDSDSYGYCAKEPASFYGDHVGIVEYVKDGYVHTIEGNYGDMVKRRKIALANSEIKGYGVPEYNRTHVHYYTDDVIVRQTSCAEAGSGKKICFCLEEFPYTIEKLSHIPAKAVKENEVKASCTAAGSYDSVVYCSVCKNEISRTSKTVKKLAHTVVTDPAVNPTCIDEGLTGGSHCSVCGTVLTAQKIIPPTGHFDENGDSVCDVCESAICGHGEQPVLSGEKKATCTEDGYTGDTVCPVCQTIKIRGKVIPASGHSIVNFVSDGNATCQSDGTKTGKCENCGETQTVTDEGSKKPHSFGARTTVTAATYTAKGKQSRTCSVCGFTEETVTDKKPTVSIAKCTFSSIKNVAYNGKMHNPSFTVKNGGKALKSGVHYSAVYSENVNPGKAKITVSGIAKNGYSGTKVLYFTIVPGKPVWNTAKQTTSSVTLSWKSVKGAEKYSVYKYSTSAGKFVKVLDTKTNNCTVKNLSSGTGYKFYVKAYAGSAYGERSSVMSIATKPAAPNAAVKQAKGKAAVTWKRVRGADGYEIYVKAGSSAYAKSGSVSRLVYVHKGLKSGRTYYFKVRAYKIYNGKKLYSAFSKGLKVKCR